MQPRRGRSHALLTKMSLPGKRRDYSIIDKSIADPKARIINCLFKQKEYQKIGKMIKDMWNIRKDKLKAKKENNETNNNILSYKNTASSDPGPKRIDRKKINLREEYWDNVGLIFRNNRGV